MSGFIEWLEELNKKDSRVRAVLRRSLAFEPGEYPTAFPYVEPFLGGEDSQWRRRAHYLAAGLWARHWRPADGSAPQALARACFDHYQPQQQSPSVEGRFVALLDSDQEQLPYRLRQMTALLKDYRVDFGALLKDLLSWNHEKKWVQNKWAQDFYRNLRSMGSGDDEAVNETNLAKEDGK